MRDLIFVCTGNTCRSPMAEGIGNKYLDSQWRIFSRGLSVSYGQRANDKSIIAMDMENIDLRHHVSKGFDISEVNEAAIILGMTQAHKDYLLTRYPRLKGQVFTLSEFVGMKGNIDDPFGCSQDVYNQCANEIKKRVIKINDGNLATESFHNQ